MRIYKASWKAFSLQCSRHHVNPTTVDVSEVLQYLQAGLDKGLAPTTLRRQVAALATVLSRDPFHSLSQDPRIKGFLRGAAILSPPIVHHYPSWDLPLVLQALTSDPFESLGSISLKFLFFKVAFSLQCLPGKFRKLGRCQCARTFVFFTPTEWFSGWTYLPAQGELLVSSSPGARLAGLLPRSSSPSGTALAHIGRPKGAP